LISEVYLSARQLIVLELELVLELGATNQPYTSLYRDAESPKANYVPFVQEPNLLVPREVRQRGRHPPTENRKHQD
jgi:hypothetical protein